MTKRKTAKNVSERAKNGLKFFEEWPWGPQKGPLAHFERDPV